MTSNADQPNNEPATPTQDAEEMRNGAGWLGFGLGAAGFLASVATAWPGAFLVATFGLALAAHGLVRVYRGRATNGRYALIGLVLAVATLALAFVWSIRAEPCRALQAEPAKWDRCYSEHTGLF
jgi:hypothetical protein